MTERDRFNVWEMRKRLADAQGWRCAWCGGDLSTGLQLAHRIPQTKANLRSYGAEIIHNRRNLGAVCSLACNAALNIGGDPGAVARLVESIKKDLTS